MRSIPKCFLTITLGFSLFLNSAQAEGMRLAVGGIGGFAGALVGSSNASQLLGLGSSRTLSWGAGLLLEAPINPTVGIELGGMFVARRFGIANNLLGVTRSIPTLMVPLEARIWLGNIFSIAAGGFAAFQLSAPTDEASIGGTPLGSFSLGSRQGTAWGLTGALTLNVATVDKAGIFLEGRYSRGLSNSASDGIFQESIDDLLLMAGARFELGHKDENQESEQ